MQEVYKWVIGIVLLVLGIPIGNFLAKKTREELSAGKKWFKLLIVISLIGAIVSVLFRQDAIMFACCFIAVVTSRSLKKRS